jgi:hypothetical protein
MELLGYSKSLGAARLDVYQQATKIYPSIARAAGFLLKQSCGDNSGRGANF